MDKLHQTQVAAYRLAAFQSIKEWAKSFPLQPMEEGDSKIAFVNRNIASMRSDKTMPNWKLDNAKITAMNEIRKRANETFDKYHPPEEEDAPDNKEDEKALATAASGDSASAEEGEEDESAEDGEETEDGELSGDENMSDQEQPTTTTTTAKPTHPNAKKKGLGGKKTGPNKKGTRAKGGFRNNKGGRGARRGGRGGGGRGGKK